MESIQDLLAPEKTNIPINEDPKTGEVSLPGATIVKIQNLDHFLQLLQVGEANRHAANTKMNTESSRSHAILTVGIFQGFRPSPSMPKIVQNVFVMFFLNNEHIKPLLFIGLYSKICPRKSQ